MYWKKFKDVRWQFEASTDNPCLVTAVVSALNISDWRHVENDGKGGWWGEKSTHIAAS
jgi:hypothetical protein